MASKPAPRGWLTPWCWRSLTLRAVKGRRQMLRPRGSAFLASAFGRPLTAPRGARPEDGGRDAAAAVEPEAIGAVRPFPRR
jgi:hypothetical protein